MHQPPVWKVSQLRRPAERRAGGAPRRLSIKAEPQSRPKGKLRKAALRLGAAFFANVADAPLTFPRQVRRFF